MNEFIFNKTIRQLKSVCPEFALLLDIADDGEKIELLNRLQSLTASPARLIYIVCNKIYNNK